MSSLLRPVGDLPPSVYWVRRALLAVAAVVILVLLSRVMGGGDQKPTAASAPADTPSPSTTFSMPAESTGPPGTLTTTPSGSASPSSSSTPSRTRPTKDDGRCTTGSVLVSVAPSARRVSTGRPLNVQVSLSTPRADGCAAAVDPARLLVTVTSGKDRIWTTAHCGKAIPRATLALAAGKPSTTMVTWDGRRSAANCPANQSTARPGTYVVQAVYAGRPSALQAFQVV